MAQRRGNPDQAAPRCAIAVMAKAPVPGLCKTRLCPPLRMDQAAALSAAFLRDITENLRRAAETEAIDPFVAYAPAGHAHLFDGVLAAGTQLILADGSTIEEPGVAGFGRCLLHALRGLLQGAQSACVLNSDSPTLPTSLLRRAATWLAGPGDRCVLGPAEDGGYYLLGVKRAHVALFADIAWSTSDVAAQTRDRARSIGLDVVELPAWYDVDDQASLGRLRAALAAGEGYAADATARALELIGAPSLLGAPAG